MVNRFHTKKENRIVFLQAKINIEIHHSKYGTQIVLPRHVRINEVKLNISSINYIRHLKGNNKFHFTIIHTKVT